MKQLPLSAGTSARDKPVLARLYVVHAHQPSMTVEGGMKMEEKLFEVQGKIKSKKMNKSFKKTVSSINENTAIEKILSLFGSKNNIKRNLIHINEVKEVKVE